MSSEEGSGDISREEAGTALAEVRRTRMKTRWADYPIWYWLTTGVGLAGLPASSVLPEGWDLLGFLVAATFICVTVLIVARARRVRGRSMPPSRTTMAWIRVLLALLLGGAILPRFGFTEAPLVAAGLLFFGYAATGIALTIRTRR